MLNAPGQLPNISHSRVPDKTSDVIRKAYHTPRMDDYGEVSELTRSGHHESLFHGDGALLYNAST